ncbi:transposase [Flavobacterium sp. LHD-80]|uniref:transposase n=1 Tax=Flavobacterium sp. LHD-80 TaxID=3071411 RepID=UPI0027DF6CC4|nr:transposase [Flavobacterium sp. LHD-80]MDQ6470130.1 transposase [Flavobacterium sp. LHD-80]
MKKKLKKYDRDFKEKAVLISFEKDNIEQVERELGITKSLLNRWRQDYNKYGSGSFPGGGNLKLDPNQKKIYDLEKKIKNADLNFEILKKSICYLNQEKKGVFHFIAKNEKVYSIRQMCRVLGVSPNTYRKWKNQFVSETQKQKFLIKGKIIEIFFNVKQRYGAKRISIELQKGGYNISSTTVGRYMRSLGLYCIIKKE